MVSTEVLLSHVLSVVTCIYCGNCRHNVNVSAGAEYSSDDGSSCLFVMTVTCCLCPAAWSVGQSIGTRCVVCCPVIQCAL